MKKNKDQKTGAFLKHLVKKVLNEEKLDAMSSEDQEKLNTGFISSHKNKRQYDELLFIWKLMGILKKVEIQSEGWNKVMAHIKAEESKEFPNKKHTTKSILRPKFSKMHSFITYKHAVVALIVLIILIYFVYTMISIDNFNNNYFYEPRVITTENAERLNIKLSDGTIVNLNSASKIKIPKKYSKLWREIYLEGEAYFTISPCDAPFLIRTQVAIVKDLGTEFNVKAYDEKVQVVVKNGKVMVSSANTDLKKEVVVTAGELCNIQKDIPPDNPQEVDVDRLLLWKKGGIVFDHSPLSEVLEELTRQYNVNFRLEDSFINIKHKTLTGMFQNEPIEEVLSAICMTFDLKYKKHDNVIVISH